MPDLASILPHKFLLEIQWNIPPLTSTNLWVLNDASGNLVLSDIPGGMRRWRYRSLKSAERGQVILQSLRLYSLRRRDPFIVFYMLFISLCIVMLEVLRCSLYREPRDGWAQPWLRELRGIYPVLSRSCLSKLGSCCLRVLSLLWSCIDGCVVRGDRAYLIYMHLGLDVWKAIELNNGRINWAEVEVTCFTHAALVSSWFLWLCSLVFGLSFDLENSSLILGNLLLIVKRGVHCVVDCLELNYRWKSWAPSSWWASPWVVRGRKIHGHIFKRQHSF